MAQFTLTIPNDKVQALLDAFAAQYPIPQAVDEETGGPLVDESGEPVPAYTKAHNAKMQVRRYVREVYKAAQANAARLAAIERAEQESEGIEVD